MFSFPLEYIQSNWRNKLLFQIRGREVIDSGKYDVVTLDWLQRVVNSTKSDWTLLDDFLPWELLCSRDTTRHKLAETYDEYYDNFIVDADEESLKRSFAKMEKSIFEVLRLKLITIYNCIDLTIQII